MFGVQKTAVFFLILATIFMMMTEVECGMSVFSRIIMNEYDKKLSYCWETARRESLPKIAKMDL